MVVVALGVSVIALAIALWALSRTAERPVPYPLGSGSPEQPLDPANPLEGLRVAIEISQDHEAPLFATLLRERLLTEDVSEATIGSGKTAGEWELLIAGTITCNGYENVYFEADLRCETPNGLVWSRRDKPADGDRPSNLAIELVSTLKSELAKLLAREERRQAIRELKEP